MANGYGRKVGGGGSVLCRPYRGGGIPQNHNPQILALAHMLALNCVPFPFSQANPPSRPQRPQGLDKALDKYGRVFLSDHHGWDATCLLVFYYAILLVYFDISTGILKCL